MKSHAFAGFSVPQHRDFMPNSTSAGAIKLTFSEYLEQGRMLVRVNAILSRRSCKG